MKIKLVDGMIYPVNRAEITNGRLEIDFQSSTAEELQEIFSAPGNLVWLSGLSVMRLSVFWRISKIWA